MSKALKSSASSRPAALKSTSAGATKAERLVTYKTNPQLDIQLAEGRRERLAALEGVSDEDIDFSDIPKTDEAFWGRGIRPNFYPAVPIDARTVEWFMARSGNRTGLMFDINQVLRDYMRAEERKAARKKAG